MRPSFGYVPRQPVSPSRNERLLAGFAIILFLIGGIGFVRDRAIKKKIVPAHGGTYTEGVLADSPTKVERVISRLTNSGLTYRGADGSIKPALADSWEVKDEGRTYTFHLRDGISAESLLGTIQSAKTQWVGIAVTAPDSQTLQFALPESLPLFLGTTTEPLFPLGPYQVVKRDPNETVLRANETFVLGAPYIQKIVVKQYGSQEDLTKAALSKEISGSADLLDLPSRSFQEYEADLPRYHLLFANAGKPSLKKQEDRLRVVNQVSGNPVSYTLVTSQGGEASTLADSLAQQMASKGVTLTVNKKNGLTLQKEDIPKREYDFLLYGVNYGIDRDYYPFWHSSQVTSTGLNLAGVKDKTLDALLETARKEVDTVKRRELNTQIETYIKDQGYQHIMGQEKTRFWIAKEILGVEYGTIDEANDRFNLVWQWHIKTKKVAE